MARLLADSPEGAKAIPFALGKLRALRAQGFSQITQHYEVLGFRVRVTINGADEYIEVRGNSWDYLVLPASIPHPEGVTTKDGKPIDPEAAMALTGSDKGLRRDEHSELLSAPHDWISSDSELALSYNHGHGFRYALGGGAEAYTGEKAIYRTGKRIKTAEGVKGAAVFRATRADGAKVQRTIYTSYVFGDLGATGLRVFYLDESDKREDGSFGEVEFASWNAPAGTVIAQPSFFDGQGWKMVTVLDTVTATGAPPDVVYTFTRPRFIVRATITVGDDDLEASFSMAPLGETEDVPTNTVNEKLYGTGDSFYYFGNPKTISSYQTYGYTGRGTRYSQTTGYEELGYSRTTTSSRQSRFIGLDIAANGTELMVERVTDAQSRTYAEETAKFDATGTGSDYELPSGFWTVALGTSSTYQRTYTRGEQNSLTVSLTINKTPVFEVVLSESSTASSRNWSSTYSGSWILDVARPPPEPPDTYSESVAETSSRRMYSLRDLDARNQAVAAVVGTYMTPFNSFILRPLKLDLVAKCHGETATKTVFDGSVYDAPVGASGDRFIHRAIASRRPGEFVICFSPESLKNPTFSDHLAATGAVVREPLFALRRKGKTITPGPDKFTLDREPGFRFDPVHIL